MMDGAFASKLPWGSFLLFGKQMLDRDPDGSAALEILWMPSEVGIDEEDD